MDLINREAVKEQAKASYHVAENMEQLGNLYEDCINALPSAFEGMTNGEVIQALFPNADYCGGAHFMHITNVNSIGEVSFPWEWWNAPYKAESEGEE